MPISNRCNVLYIAASILMLFALSQCLIQATGDTGILRRLQRNAEEDGNTMPSTSTKVIESFHIKSDIRFRFATTQIVSVVRNKADFPQEIVFDVALPKEAFIVSFSMAIDGKVIDGEVKEKAQAKKEYQTAVDRGESAGIVQNAPRHSNTFEISVNVASGSAVNFTLNYQELLQRKLGLYEYEIHVKPGQAVEDFLVEVNIQENKKIGAIRTPALRTDSLLTNKVADENPLTIIERISSQSAKVLFKPSKAQQGQGGVAASFVVQYDVEHPPKGEIMIVDGYFIHFFAPDLPPMPKDIIFVLDLSGSMHGTRLAQLKTAMKVILKDLKPQDKFNIITFSSDVQKWQKNPVFATADQISAADKFVLKMDDGGMTNINFALITALNELKTHSNKERASMVFFLTDGEPTEGEINFEKIAINVREANGKEAAIFSLAFGEGANYQSLQTISAQNSGFARKIYEASDAALQVASLYQEISAVVMKDISISFLPSSVDEFTLTDNKFPNIFNGSEVVVCGQVLDKAREFQLSIKGVQQSGEVNLILETDDISNLILNPEDPLFSGPRNFAGIVEKMWAYLTIKQLLREKDKNLSDKKVMELDKKILDMSLKYQFVTPLTAMVVTKPGQQEPSESILKDKGNEVTGEDPPIIRAQASSSFGQMGSIAYRHYRQKLSYGSSSAKGFLGEPVFLIDSGAVGKSHTKLWPQKRKQPRKITENQKKSNIWFKDFPLSAFAIKIGKKSVCVVPKKLESGVYRLVVADDGYFINLEVGCSNLPCVSQKAMKIMAYYKNTNATVELVNIATDSWKYSASSNFRTEQLGNNFTVTGENAKLSFFWHTSGSKGYYDIIIELDPGKKYTGLTAEIMRKAGKQQKKKVESACKSLQTQASIKFNKKLARKYRIGNV
ncbi:unnamed protein product [Lymnaea stagnalis]|uniref:Inter-alpha-trypsin inhibitor heavy chain H4 n=1 Tax=Lymnaea stagnalis TaxID=6523 RepID=A0AAV2H222_LYMST